ncbi:hypothetical protein [Humibacillus xanthopallidus]|uniref:hypothetical protein n=1 Tax=Humibacillus xanthopallidus TaxID=412689 RepID=UPI0038500BDF
MPNRFPGQPCVLCPNPSVGVGEHVWSQWLVQEFGDQGPFTSSKGGVPYTKRDGVTVVRLPALPSVHVPMCKSCNELLNRTIEQPVKDIGRRLIPWSEDHAWPLVTAEESAALARWYLKIGLLSAHPKAVHDNPHVDRDEDLPRFASMEPEWLDWMRDGSPPPDGFSIFVTRRAVAEETPWEGETARIFLPHVRVGSHDLRYASRSFGIRGLNISIVWHPSWPILHPLVEAGRACQIWPSPVNVDFGALPELNPREFSFVEGIGVMAVTEDEFARMTENPLQVGVDPVSAFFGT